MTDLELYRLLAWSFASLLTGSGIGWYARGRLALPHVGRPAWMRGLRFDKYGGTLAQEKPHQMHDDDKQLLAIRNELQQSVETRMHRLKDTAPLDYWHDGIHREWNAKLESVSRFVTMPSISRKKYWQGSTETYQALLHSFHHRGLILCVSEKPSRYVWSGAWSTCRRRVNWWQAKGYRLPPPREWEDSPTE
jgi:hypothetical protein